MNPARWPAIGQLALAFAAGAATVLAYAPFGLGLLSLLTTALLFHLWRYPARPGLNPWTGYAFGLGLLGFGVFWLRISIAQFGGVTPALAVAATSLFVLLMALYFALAGWVGERLRGRSDGVWLLSTLPAVWILFEWLRGWLLTGFPWLLLGYGQIDLPLGGYAPVFGVFGVGLLLTLSAGALNLWRRPVVLVPVLAIWAGGVALPHVEWTRPAGPPIRVSLLQGSIPQAQKWLASMRGPTLDLYLGLTEQVADSRIVIWPETAVPAFASDVEATLLAPLHERMRRQGRDLLLGIVDGDRDGDYYNAMLSVGISGRDHYHKRHLVPFGEYLPLDRWTRPVLDFLEIPMSDFSPGADVPPLITLAGQPVGIDICYEDAFPVEIMRALPEATLLINASNDAWFGDSLAPHQHLEIARMRALETGRYLLRATNTGISAVIDPRGRLRATSPQFEQAVLTDDVVPRTGATPFVRWGNGAVLALALLMLLPGIVQRSRA
jgi:apolipoprotein N-acyltransferase